MQREFPIVVDDRMPRVCAALEPYDHIAVFRQYIGYLSLAFIAPVCPDDHLNHGDDPLSRVELFNKHQKPLCLTRHWLSIF